MNAPRVWGIVPAAGSGNRFGGAIPKQYLELNGRTVLGWVLARLAACSHIETIVLVLAPDDTYWSSLAPVQGLVRQVECVEGGAQRQDSVRAGLAALTGRARPDDWVLVHDAARPCVSTADIERLITCLAEEPAGGLLGVPVSDTLKRIDADAHVEKTLQRDGIWRAFTPQMFRYGLLVEALDKAAAGGHAVTDEAAAMELAGYRPRLVNGRADNIKLTHASDLVLAARILAAQEDEA